jgi:hypothetical protein
MDPIIPQLAGAMLPAMQALVPMGPRRRLATSSICDALTSVEPLLAHRYGGPVYRRFEGCVNKNEAASLRVDGTPFKVLEYLWDFSISRFSVPQAIEDPNAPPLNGAQFDLLFAAESELGTGTEVCRDLLKLVLGRAIIRCLVYRLPDRQNSRTELEARIVRVMRNYAHFADDPGLWILAGLHWDQQGTRCTMMTLNDTNDGLVAVPMPVGADAV